MTRLRELRISHRDNQEGQQRVFYTLEELQEQLKTVLQQLKASQEDFRAAINFIHQVQGLGCGQLLVGVATL